MNDENRYSALIKTRAPEVIRAAVELAATHELMTTSAYAQKAIVNQLRADGFWSTIETVAGNAKLPKVERRAANSWCPSPSRIFRSPMAGAN